MISPNCVSGFDSLSKGLVFQSCNCNCFTAVGEIYLLDPNQPSAPFLELQLHLKMLKSGSINVWSKVPVAFCRLMRNPHCPRLLWDAFCPEPCLPFKAPWVGKFSSKLSQKAVERQKSGLFNFTGAWGLGLG